MKKIFLFFLSLFAFAAMAQEISLIPQPVEVSVKSGKFVFAGEVVEAYPKAKNLDVEDLHIDKLNNIGIVYD